MTKIELEIITDPEMCMFFEKGTRDGISYIFDRYSKVNNKYLKSYHSKQESKHIIYLDANNVNGCATSRFLATSEFKCLDTKEFDLDKYTSNSSKGCVFRVNLEYPKELRELHNDYSLSPYQIEIKKEMLCEYQLNIADLYNIPIGAVKTLVHNFPDKEMCVLHYGNLHL